MDVFRFLYLFEARFIPMAEVPRIHLTYTFVNSLANDFVNLIQKNENIFLNVAILNAAAINTNMIDFHLILELRYLCDL